MLEHLKFENRKIPEGFDWMAVLKDLIAGAPITNMDHSMLLGLSGDWPTCACGQLCSSLPRHPSGCPQDPWLKTMGTMFHTAISFKNWHGALNIMRNIESRTTELLSEEVVGPPVLGEVV